jgi:hypothetical protein
MTMTDNDDPAPPRDPPSSDGPNKDEPRKGATRPGEHRLIRWARGSGTAAHVAPTDPEVPRAKRRGAIRRRRSLVGLTAVVMGLLSITLALLYRASQRVGVGDRSGYGVPWPEGNSAPPSVKPADVIDEGTFTRLVTPPPAGSELGDDVPAADQSSTDSAPGEKAFPPAKGPPPSPGIIRTPAF